MDRLNYFSLIVLCVTVIVIKSNLVTAHETDDLGVTPDPSDTLVATVTAQDTDTDSDTGTEFEYEADSDRTDKPAAETEQRSIASNAEIELPLNNADRHAAFRKRAKPLKSIFMGIYKNYKSTYLGNKTLAEYKRTLKTQVQNDETPAQVEEEHANVESITEINDADEIQTASTEAKSVKEQDLSHDSVMKEAKTETEIETESSKKKKKKQRAQKRNRRRKKHAKHHIRGKKASNSKESPVLSYDFGPAVNMSLDMNNEIVKVHLDGENLRDIMQGRWLKSTSEGRGKKYEMITRVLPLFILPFLIQSAVVPFLVTKLKLLLMKSILVGKLAIFLLIVSAIKNSNKAMQTYEVAPSYWAGEPSRRSELAAAASAAAYNGYRVEGKPTAWIN